MAEKIELKLYEPTQPQLDALKIIHVDQPLFSIIAFGRQTGKTYMAIRDAISMALNNKRLRIMFVSPTYLNNVRIMGEIDAMFLGREDLKEVVFKTIKYKEQSYVFHNGSRIDMRSAEQGDTLRGAPQDLIYIDEMAFMKREFVYKVLLPMVIRTNGKIIGLSTFNGRNWFYKLYNDGLKEENHKEVKSIVRTYLDLHDENVNKVIEGLRKAMTNEEFLQEVMCRPVSKDTLFASVEDCIGEPDEHDDNTELFIGIDLGMTSDYTVVTVMNQKYQVIDIDRFNMRSDHLSPKEFKDRIMAKYYEYFDRLTLAYVEVNNNELLFEELEENYENSYKLFPFKTTPENKPKMINFLIKAFEEYKITIPNYEELIAELYGFKSKKNPITGRLQYTNIGVDHDDMVMSLAIACECVREEYGSGIIEFI